jgi:hypothetical protein
METNRSRANKSLGARGGDRTQEYVWWLQANHTNYGSPNQDHDRVYLRLEGGIQWIVLKTRNGDGKKDKIISFSVTEFDMLSILLSERYNNTGPIHKLSNGRRRIVMEEEEDRVRFTLVKYVARNSSWTTHSTVTLTKPKVKNLMSLFEKIHNKLSLYEEEEKEEEEAAEPFKGDDSDDSYIDDDSYESRPITPPKSRRLDNLSSLSGGDGVGYDEH